MEIITGEQDFVGQQLAEARFTKILNVFGVIGWLVGFYLESFKYTFYFVAAGALLAVLITVPAWPTYRKNPLPWRAVPPKDDSTTAKSTATTPNNKKRDTKKTR